MGNERPEVASSAASSAVSDGNYAPSPGICSHALTRANHLRVQTLLRQLLSSKGPQRIDVVRVLRKTMRELDYQISWFTQVDFFETIERVLGQESELDTDWRVTNDCLQLLIEFMPRLPFEPDPQMLEGILAMVVPNLGHPRSEVRRSSLLLLNLYINEGAGQFQAILRLLIEHGLENHRNPEAQRGAILSLPLLMTEHVVEGEDLLPLVKCLSALLVDSNSQLFYSLYLALQRLHMNLGERQFKAYLRQCEPEAELLYKQTASRNNSIASQQAATLDLPYQPRLQSPAACRSPPMVGQPAGARRKRSSSLRRASSGDGHHLAPQRVDQMADSGEPAKQVTFENELESRVSSDTLNSSPFEADSCDEQSAARRRAFAAADRAAAAGSPSTSDSASQLGGAPSKRASVCPADSRKRATGAPLEQESSVSSTCSSEANLVDPAHYMHVAALRGNPLADYEKIHHENHSTVGLAINDLHVSSTPTIELGSAPQNELKFGIFSRHLVSAALNARSPDRLEALQEMMCIIRDSPINHLAILMTYFDSFLEQFLARLIEPGTEYKVELIAIDMIETIVIKTKISTTQYVRPMISLLMRTIGDSRSIFRDNTTRVIHKMMAFLPPQHVIDAIFEHKHNKNPLVREESANRVTAAVLEYDKNEFNLTKLCYHVLPMLADQHANVRLAALECIAALANALGPERIGSLLTAAEAVQTGCDYDGLLDAIHARLMRRALPRCSSDGSVRYVIKPFLNLANANFHREHQAADVRWVLEAPSSHQHVAGAGHPPGQHQTPAGPSQLDQQHWQLTHSHRPGAYSPPDVIHHRSAVSVSQLMSGQLLQEHEPASQHVHHHHGATFHANPDAEGAGIQDERRPRRQSRAAGAPNGSSGGQQATNYTSSGAPSNGPAGEASRAQTTTTTGTLADQRDRRPSEHGARSETSKRRQSQASMRGGSLVKSQSIEAERSIALESSGERSRRKSGLEEKELPRAKGAKVRSNSEESSSSADTNKALFQYYLTKFKQSLERQNSGGSGQSVLPSDSIIYTDTAQAYALSRHQSRYQQTSFDYDSDTVGQIAPGPLVSPPRKLVQDNEQSVGAQLDAGQPTGPESLSASERSASESPLTVRAASPRRLVQSRHPSITKQQPAAQTAHRRSKSISSGRDLMGLAEAEDPREAVKRGPRRLPRHGDATGEQRAGERHLDSLREAQSPTSRVGSSRRSGSVEKSAEDSMDGGRARRHAKQDSTGTASDSSQRSDHAGRANPEEAPSEASCQRGEPASRRGSEAALGRADGDRLERPRESRDEVRRRASRSQPPPHGRRRLARLASQTQDEPSNNNSLGLDPRRAASVSPSLANSQVNIRHVLENVAQIEGPFEEPQLAFKVAMDALSSPCWSTKVEGILAFIRLANFHQHVVLSHLHDIIGRTASETANLRSTVARSAIYALGDFSASLKRAVEPELDLMVQALLQKSSENTAFIRDDIRRALDSMVEHVTQWRLAGSLINHGGAHKSVNVRRMASQCLAALVERMGAAKCLVGARDISAQLIPAAARFAQDSSPHTRFHGRSILARLMQHSAFERLLRKHLPPNLYRSTLGIIESVRRRGPGEPPVES